MKKNWWRMQRSAWRFIPELFWFAKSFLTLILATQSCPTTAWDKVRMTSGGQWPSLVFYQREWQWTSINCCCIKTTLPASGESHHIQTAYWVNKKLRGIAKLNQTINDRANHSRQKHFGLQIQTNVATHGKIRGCQIPFFFSLAIRAVLLPW